MTDDRKLLFDTLHTIALRCGYILNTCKGEREMRLEASEILNLANKALLAEPKPVEPIPLRTVYMPCAKHTGMSWTMNVGYVAPAKQVCPICEPPVSSVGGRGA